MSFNIRIPTSGQPHVDYQKPSVPGSFQMANFQSPGSKITIAERFTVPSNVCPASTSSATAELRASTPPPTEISPRRGPPNLASAKIDVSTPPPSVLLTARVIENLSKVAYPEGIRGPRVELNANVKDGRFRYDRDFLMQFMHICKEKPPTLPALDVLGIEPVDQTSFPKARGGSGRHRNACSASASCATAELCGSMPCPTEIPRRRPGPLDLTSAKRDVSTPLPSALLTARVIENLSEVAYPEGIKGPRVELNMNVRDGRFRYDRDFLMQFMHICKEKPPTLPALDVLGIESVDRTLFPVALGGSGCHRTASGTMPVSANRQASVDLDIGGLQKPRIPSGFQMGIFQSPGSKLTSEERFSMSNSRSASTSSASSQFRSTVACTPSTGGPGHPTHGTKRIRTKRGERRGGTNKLPMSQEEHSSGIGAASILGAGFESVTPLKLSANRWVPTSTTRKAQPDVDSPELVDRKVKALLNKLTMEKFETISDQIIHWANKSVIEKDGRTLIQVTRLVFENLKATDEAWSGMYYARLCRKMMEQISPEVQDEGIKNTKGKPVAGGQLFRKHLLNRCQEDFERGWLAKEAAAAVKTSDDYATKAAHKRIGTKEAELCFDEYYAAEKARRQGLVLIRFIGELFKLQMLTERIMHQYVKKLLADIENPEEEKIESLCQLLKTVGQLLDTPKARAHMDVYFTRMKELGKCHNVSTRMQFMLQDVIELRDRAWMSRNAAPMTIAAIHVLAAQEKAATDKRSFNGRQISMFRGSFRGGVRGGFRRGDSRNREHGPDGLAVAGGSSVSAGTSQG